MPHQTEQYCLILAYKRWFSNKVSIKIDYGQQTSFFTLSEQRLKDERGNVKSFDSVIDALNYMASDGWVFVNAYSLSVDGQNVLHYVLKKNV